MSDEQENGTTLSLINVLSIVFVLMTSCLCAGGGIARWLSGIE